MRHRTPRARGQPLRAVCPRNVVRLFRPKGRNWMPRIYSGHPTVRLPQTEAWAERERVPSGHNCRRQLATGRPEQIQEPGTAVPGTPIFANIAAGRAASGVAVPLAFFGTFFRFERKYCPPQGGSPSVRAVVGASSSSEGVLMTKLAHIDACRGLSARPLHPFGSPSETNQQPHGAAPTLPRQSQCVSPSPSSCKPPYEW